MTPDAVVESAGQPQVEHVAYARELRGSIPGDLYDAAHSRDLSMLLALALLLDPSGKSLESQKRLIEERLGSERARVINGYYEKLQELPGEHRLPLLELLFPALKLRPEPQLGFLLDLASRLIEIDGAVDLYEYAFYRILHINVHQAVKPSFRRPANPASRAEVRKCVIDLLTVVAEHGHDDPDEQRLAFEAGRDTLPKWAATAEFRPQRRYSVSTLDHSLDVLLVLNGKGRRSLLRAASTVAAHDGQLTVAEGELIRVICATLDVPLPPIAATAAA